MATLRTNKKHARIRDAQQCKICGATLPVPFGRLEVHHIIYRSQGGPNDLENLVTLCDLCHAVVHEHMGPAWVGLSKLLRGEMNKSRQILNQAREEFDTYLRLPAQKRQRIQEEIWPEWGIQNLKHEIRST